MKKISLPFMMQGYWALEIYVKSYLL